MMFKGKELKYPPPSKVEGEKNIKDLLIKSIFSAQKTPTFKEYFCCQFIVLIPIDISCHAVIDFEYWL